MKRSNGLGFHLALLVLIGGAAVVSSGTAASGAEPAAVWTELAPTGTAPAPDTTPVLAGYDPASNRAVVITHHGRGNPDQAWVVVGANGMAGTPAWEQLAVGGTPPVATGSESATYDPTSNRLIVYGGCTWSCSPAREGVFVLTNANGLGGSPAWSELAVTDPQPRDSHSAVYSRASDSLVAFGGDLAFPGTNKNDTRTLSNASGAVGPATWTSLEPAGGPPSIRSYHTATYDAAGDRMTVFGGQEFIRCCAPDYIIEARDDTWVLSDASGANGPPTWTQLQTATAPSPRAYHSAVYDDATRQMFVYGGYDFRESDQQTIVNDELWVLDNANGQGGEPAWTPVRQSGAAPGARYGQSAAWDAGHRRMMMLGGSTASGSPTNQLFVADMPVSRTGQQTTSVTVTAAPGVLTVTLPQASVAFGQLVSGSTSPAVGVGDVLYVNTLGTGNPWGATVASTSLSSGPAVIPFTRLAFAPGPAITSGEGSTANLTPGAGGTFGGPDAAPGTTFSDPLTLVTGPAGAQGSFTQSGSTVTLHVPATSPAGSYSGTLQYTIVG
jgi:hypothetical protein